MASLEELLKIDGVVAAGEFARDGALIDFKSSMDMSPELELALRSSAPPCRCCSTR